jgi:hypothetical protein
MYIAATPGAPLPLPPQVRINCLRLVTVRRTVLNQHDIDHGSIVEHGVQNVFLLGNTHSLSFEICKISRPGGYIILAWSTGRMKTNK